MNKTELIEEILKTYDGEMAGRYTAFLRRQSKASLEEILAARKNIKNFL